MEDVAHQKWYIDLSNLSMCITYTKLRCSNSKLPIYNTIYLYDTQKCTSCNLDALGDE